MSIVVKWSRRSFQMAMRAITVLGSAVVVALISTSPLAAQSGAGDRGGGGWGMMMGAGMMMGPGMMGRDGAMCSPRTAGFAEWRVDRIERAVKPTEAQRAALNDLKAASVKAAEAMAAICSRQPSTKVGERLEFMEKRMEAMLQAVKTVRPAFDAFYASLTDEQKTRLDSGAPRGWGWHRWR
jgi:hypothetical protein